MTELRPLLRDIADQIADYRESIDGAPVAPTTELADVIKAFDLPLTDVGVDTAQVIGELANAAQLGLVQSAGPRYFGFVLGGSIDAALCADLLVVGWDQVAFNAVTSPAAFAAEVVAGRWVKELLGLPASASIGFVTGGQAANTVALAAARTSVLERAGWDDQQGLFGAPPIRVLVGDERHQTIDRSLRLLGIGEQAIEPLATDSQGALTAEAVAQAFRDDNGTTPTIVCTQAGNVATGAFDEIGAICAIAHAHNAWVHVDGAFGLWAAASPNLRHLAAGIERADSWGTDAHKWLNVTYDCGLCICADPRAHGRAMRYTAAYLTGQSDVPAIAGADLTPESSRRARGIPVWAAIRELGRTGVAELVDRCCALARRFASELGKLDGVEIGNDVVLNQVLVSFADDAHTDRVVEWLQREGTLWVGATTWRGRRFMRISVSGWLTTEADVDKCVAAMAAAHQTADEERRDEQGKDRQ